MSVVKANILVRVSDGYWVGYGARRTAMVPPAWLPLLLPSLDPYSDMYRSRGIKHKNSPLSVM